MKRLIYGAAAVLAFACQPGYAQLQIGQRVRVLAPSAGFQIISGVVVLELTPDSLRVERKGMQQTIARSSIVRLDVSEGRRGRMTSAGIGTLGGTALGLAVGWQYNKNGPFINKGLADSLYTAPDRRAEFMVAGGILGAVFGILIPSHRWRTVPVDVVADVAPTRNGAAITLTRRF